MKKGTFGWDIIGKILLMLIIMLVLLTIIGLLSGKSNILLDKIRSIVQFRL